MAIPIHFEYITYKFDRKLSSPVSISEYQDLKNVSKKGVEQLIELKTKNDRPFRTVVLQYFSKKKLIAFCVMLLGCSAYTILTWNSKSAIIYALGIIPLLLIVGLLIYVVIFFLSLFKTLDSYSDYEHEMRIYFVEHKNIIDRTRNYAEYQTVIVKSNSVGQFSYIKNKLQ
jgi:hypothetical protein